MLTPVRTMLLLCTAVVAAAAAPARAAESYDNCAGTITSLPATLTTQGTWCLQSDLATAITSGAAITVATNNVTIACNDFKLGGLQAGPGTQAIGIAAPGRSNLTVRGCNVRGFFIGVQVDGGVGHVVEDNRFEGNTYAGIWLNAAASVARRNLIIDTGGSTLAGMPGVGIAAASGTDVLDNTVVGVSPSTTGGSVVGISSEANLGTTIRDNRVGGLLHFGVGASGTGIDHSGGYAVIEGNAILGLSAGTVGIACEDVHGTSVRNTIVGFGAGVTGCHSTGDVYNPG